MATLINERTIMRLSRLLLAVCLLASLGCDPDIGNIGLDSELLTVNVSTVGANLDPDGYTLSITGQRDEPIAINDTRTFSVLRFDHTVELRGVAGNCVVANNPRTFSVNGPTTTSFLVECS